MEEEDEEGNGEDYIRVMVAFYASGKIRVSANFGFANKFANRMTLHFNSKRVS